MVWWLLNYCLGMGWDYRLLGGGNFKRKGGKVERMGGFF